MAKRYLSLSLVLVACGFLPLSAQAAFKCWTNKEGVRECGNAIPPEYAQQESATVNERGITIEVQKRAKTHAEVEAERTKVEAEKKRLADEKERKEKQAALDRVLLATFTSVEDIQAARDRRLTSIDGTIDITRVTIDKLNQNLAALKQRAATQERQGKPISDDLKQDITSTEKQIADKQRYIQSKERVKADINHKAEADIARFKELKGL